MNARKQKARTMAKIERVARMGSRQSPQLIAIREKKALEVATQGTVVAQKPALRV